MITPKGLPMLTFPTQAAWDERLAEGDQVGEREIYVHYAEDIATSKLRIPAAREGTARNMNTIAKLTNMADALTHM